MTCLSVEIGKLELMSILTKEQVYRFLAPLRGNFTILLMHDIKARMQLSTFLLRCASLQSADTTVLDVDAFYCTNADRFPDDVVCLAGAELLLLPEQEFEVSSLLPLISSKREFLIIDGLNSLYSLASDGRKSHQLTVLANMLSRNASSNKSWVVATAYRTEQNARHGGTNQRSLTGLGDLLVDADFRGGSLKLRAGFKGRWPNDELDV
jgi:hypothetical protein